MIDKNCQRKCCYTSEHMVSPPSPPHRSFQPRGTAATTSTDCTSQNVQNQQNPNHYLLSIKPAKNLKYSLKNTQIPQIQSSTSFFFLYIKNISFPEGMLWSIVYRLKDVSIHSNNRKQMTTREFKNM